VTTETPSTEKQAPPKRLQFKVHPRFHKKLKKLAVDRDITLEELCATAVEKYLEAQ